MLKVAKHKSVFVALGFSLILFAGCVNQNHSSCPQVETSAVSTTYQMHDTPTVPNAQPIFLADEGFPVDNITIEQIGYPSTSHHKKTSNPKEIQEHSLTRQYTPEEIDMLAQMVWGEARGTTRYEQKLVVWVVLQRLKSDCGRWPYTIAEVVTQNRQFHGFNPSFPIDDEIRGMVEEVLEYWASGGEPKILYPYATSIPYFFFWGDGQNNWFRQDW